MFSWKCPWSEPSRKNEKVEALHGAASSARCLFSESHPTPLFEWSTLLPCMHGYILSFQTSSAMYSWAATVATKKKKKNQDCIQTVILEERNKINIFSRFYLNLVDQTGGKKNCFPSSSCSETKATLQRIIRCQSAFNRISEPLLYLSAIDLLQL